MYSFCDSVDNEASDRQECLAIREKECGLTPDVMVWDFAGGYTPYKMSRMVSKYRSMYLSYWR